MTIRQAFEVSAGWVFIELAKKIGREKYSKYLDLCKYGNSKLSEKGVDFWNFGAFAISPINQIRFLLKLYNKQLPFSARNLEITRKVMIAERLEKGTISAKTGWTRVNGKDIGWWVGFIERQDNVYFFATRLARGQNSTQTNFGKCRKEVTKNVFRQLKVIR
jgi:beta-lactamase class D